MKTSTMMSIAKRPAVQLALGFSLLAASLAGHAQSSQELSMQASPLQASVMAAQRSFPAGVRLYSMHASTEPMTVLLNGERVRLAPGATIRDLANLLVLPAHLASRIGTDKVDVAVLTDLYGQALRIWLIDAKEKAALTRK